MYPSNHIASRRRDEKTAVATAEQTPHTINMKAALKHEIYDAAGEKLRFGDIFPSRAGDVLSQSLATQSPTIGDTSSTSRLLVVFIRHFFCGNCQEYLRCLVTNPNFSALNLAVRNIEIAIIGCGAPTMITSYRALTGLPSSWKLYADPSTELYRLLGMHRSLSLGNRPPRYIQRSLTGNMMRSVVQGLKRIPDGDVLGAGGWDVNGGEFFFELHGDKTVDTMSWKLRWCHRMMNSRDHTEVEDLLVATGLTSAVTTDEPLATRPRLDARTQSSPMVLKSVSMVHDKLEAVTPLKRRPSLRKSLSIRRQSWMSKSTSLSQSMSLKVTAEATTQALAA